MDREFIEKVRQSVDIVDVIGRYVNLKKTGKQYRGLCPFHKEKTPSFYVNPEKGVYHCFGCGASGNVFRFLMEMEKMTFTEAVLELAKEAGIPIPEKVSGKGEQERPLQALEFAAEFYHKMLFSQKGKNALNYLKNRGLRVEVIGLFRLGYAPPEGNALVKAALEKGFTEQELIEAGLASEREGFVFDQFRNRVMFPIRNIGGTIVGFGGRTLSKDVEPKYLNSPDTPYFKKGELLFGLHEVKNNLRAKNVAVIVEGYMDFLMLYEVGLRYAVAPLGTALTEMQANILRRYAKRVFLLYDGDEAGLKAARRSIPILLGAGIIPRVALLPKDEDPASMVQNGKIEMLRKVLREAKDVVEFLLLDERSRSSDPSVLSDFINESLEVLSNTSDEVYLDLLLRMFCEKTGLSFDVARSKVNALKEKALSQSRLPKRRQQQDVSRLISGEFRSVAWGFLMPEAREVLLQLRTDDFEHEDAKLLFQSLVDGQGVDELMAQASDSVRNKFARILTTVKKEHLENEKILENIRIFVNKKLAKRVRKQLALAKGNDEVNNILINYEKLVRKEGTAL